MKHIFMVIFLSVAQHSLSSPRHLWTSRNIRKHQPQTYLRSPWRCITFKAFFQVKFRTNIHFMKISFKSERFYSKGLFGGFIWEEWKEFNLLLDTYPRANLIEVKANGYMHNEHMYTYSSEIGAQLTAPRNAGRVRRCSTFDR